MGKAKEERIRRRRYAARLDHGQRSCDDLAAPICECCSLYDDRDDEKQMKDLIVIGAGPHGMALVLRLLQPNADLMTEKERHLKAEHHSSKIRSIPEVRRYCRNLSRGGTASIYKKKDSKIVYSEVLPPPIDLVKLRKATLVIDKTHASDKDSGWLSHWNENFDAIEIPYLRSPTNAHLDPFDHRSLDIYAEVNGRQEELVSLKYLKQRDREFHGPYQAPSTTLFKDFHSVLSKAYGIEDMIQSSSEVISIVPKSGSKQFGGEPYFEVHVKRVTKKKSEGDINAERAVIVKAKRVVCAMGPMFQTGSEFWEESLPETCRRHILHCHEIVPWILSYRKHQSVPNNYTEKSLLIVGGGITSAHLALLAARAPWCKWVLLIQRSVIKERQFDIENKWMGPTRGKLLDKFWSLDSYSKVQFLKESRKGGSIPPELAHKLIQSDQNSGGRIEVKQEVQISDVSWNDDQFCVQLDDGSSAVSFDKIWLATGADNDIDLYPCFQQLRTDLPIDVVAGLPILDTDLSWKRSSSSNDTEDPWKGILRSRLHVMGSLAGLELGPDALNLIGARHGAVRIAKAIRKAMYNK